MKIMERGNNNKKICFLFISLICLLIMSNNLICKEIKGLLTGLVDQNGFRFTMDSIKYISDSEIKIFLACSSDCTPCVSESLNIALKKHNIDFCIYGFVNEKEKQIINYFSGLTKLYFDQNNKIIRYLRVRKTPIIMVINKKFKFLKFVQLPAYK